MSDSFNRVIFIHIGKTSGTSIKDMLRLQQEVEWDSPRHFSAEMIKKKLGSKIFDETFKFTVVRNPFDRFRSACRQTRNDPNSPVLLKQFLDGAVQNTLTKEIMRPMSDTLLIDGELAVDEVFRFEEDVPERVHRRLNEIGIPGEYPHRRKTRREPLILDSIAIEFVRDFYAKDFELFDYDTTPKN